MQAYSNILLIGMPGCGKSTLGVLLARVTARDFIDTDLLIQNRAGCTLQEILEREGHLALRQLEADVLLDLQAEQSVIATGGSAVHSEPAIKHLKRSAFCVYLQLDVAGLLARIQDMGSRGIARPAGQSFEQMFNERDALYRQHADALISMQGLGVEQSLQAVLAAIR